MPLPIILGGIAAVAGATGVGSIAHGGRKMKKANDTMKKAKEKQESAVQLYNDKRDQIFSLMDGIGKQELEIMSSFKHFSDIIEKIQGRPEFRNYRNEKICLPEYTAEKIKEISTGASVLLGGLGGAAAGTAGGFAAAGAATAAVTVLGTASTGTAIASLSGAAATNATLAALGGGALAAGGGGMALGSVVLGGATLGVGLLVGGVIFGISGTKLSDKAEVAYEQAERTEQEVRKIIVYFDELNVTANLFQSALSELEEQYRKRLDVLDYIVNFSGKVEWSEFNYKEKQITGNTVLLVGMLHKMCKTKLVLKTASRSGINKVNSWEVKKVVGEANQILNKK